VWAYWPTLLEVVGTWWREPDYSHGFLVVPLTVVLLWMRRESCPKPSNSGLWLGLVLMLLSLALRYAGARYYMSFLDATSIVVWGAAVVALLWGRQIFWWSAPALAFLLFTIPLPFSLEMTLSLPLQRVATKASVWVLQLVGLPAFNTGNVITVGSHRLEVAQACSGLRLFLGVTAMAYAYILFSAKTWWTRIAIVLAAAPIAIGANVARIVVTGVLLQWTTTKAAAHQVHDAAGLIVVPLSALLFWCWLKYLSSLLVEVEDLTVAEVVRRSKVASG